jgi:isoquinoline 1-oxidoreductase
MSITRRQFLASMGGTGLFYAFRFTTKADVPIGPIEPIPTDDITAECRAEYPDIDYRDWIAFGPDGNVSVFTGRTELGQGLKTVITAVVTQGLEISQEKLTVVQGDTDQCPDDGVTSGSSSTRIVGWGFWLACEKIRNHLVDLASLSIRIPVDELEFRKGGVGLKGNTGRLISAFELGQGQAVKMDVNLDARSTGKQYIDIKIPNVNAEEIVTGSQKFVGDLKMPKLLYAGWLVQPYHKKITRLQFADMDAARALPGVKMVDIVHGRVAVIGERYSDVLKALALVKQTWSIPTRPKELPLEESRAGAQLMAVREEQGDINTGLSASEIVLSETYTTQYATHVQLETDTAVARLEDGGDRVTVWVSSQYPYKARELVARYLDRPLSKVRAIAMPAGGAFGGRQGNPVNWEAAKLASLVQAPVKLVYSRKDQFQLLSLYKAACIIDVTMGVSSKGKMLARKVDVYQDMGNGTTHTYDIPNVLVKAYRADWPFDAVSSRGTSFVQTCFATESHVDMVADRLGMDPLEFRCRNVQSPAFIDLINYCSEMIGYGRDPLDIDEGIGLAIVNHGGTQLGAVAAKVAVDRVSGRVKVKQIAAAFDIGIVINRNTALVGIRGGIAWGIGYALSEEFKLNGHSPETGYLSQYRIPRFSDIPPIDIAFFYNFNPDSGPRGCGEMPVIPTIGAIANAVYNAIGIRFYSTPITPERVKQALGSS